MLSPIKAEDPLRVLLVDDEPRLRNFLQEELEAEDYVVLATADAASAWSHLLQNPLPDLVVLDWSLPDGSGPELCQRMRKEGITTPVLMLTGHDDVGDRVLALDAGVDDYLVKPFSVDELLARLRALQRRRWQAEPRDPDELLLFHGLEINLTAVLASVAGKALDLLSKEYRLLTELVRAGGQPLTASQLLRETWNDLPEEQPLDLLEVYLESLQRKLLASGGPMLKAVPGTEAWALLAPDVAR